MGPRNLTKSSIVLIMFCILALFSCGPKQEKVEKIMEDGVEVVINHLEPYKLNGKLATVTLAKEFVIDTEKDDLVDIGFYQPETFDVDSDGNIYFIQWESSDNYIFKFDSKGSLLKSFCRRGQGPGELEYGGAIVVTPTREIMAKGPAQSKFEVFDLEGNYLKTVQMGRVFNPIPLQHDEHLVFWGEDTPETRKQFVGVCNSEFKNIKQLEYFQYPNSMNVKSPVNRHRLIYTVSQDKIFIANSEKGYEIQVFDFKGNLIQKIRKNFQTVKVSEEYEEKYFNRIPEGYPLLKNLYFEEYWPPFWDLFTDDEGSLFVLTPEEGVNPGEYWHDIFNSDGVFISRLSLSNSKDLHSYPFTVKSKNKLLYCLREKESGFKELIVYKMIWE